MKRVALISLGCAKNLVDSEMILAMFPRDAYVLTTSAQSADLIIINTCGFIESAKKESIDAIFEYAQYGAKLVVVGCLAERYYEELKKEIPEADLIVPIKDYKELASRLNELLGSDDINPINPLRRIVSTSTYSAYLRISDGCDNFCAFCAIPFIRGRFVSRPFDEIIEEAKKLRDSGVKEISLISQDTTVYGKDFPNKKPNICYLLRELDDLGFYSIRLLYLYPSEIEDELIDLIANSKSISHYFDIPVQCASDHLLEAMRRHSDQSETLALFKKIKKKCPDAILRTTLIAGFPGETEEDIDLTLKFLNEVEFDHMGCFTYSPEEGTLGAKLPNQIPEEIKEERKNVLMKEQSKISYRLNKARIGKVYEGLVIGKKQGKYMLRCVWNAPDDIDGDLLFSSDKPLKEGDIVKVKITNAFVYDLEGERVD